MEEGDRSDQEEKRGNQKGMKKGKQYMELIPNDWERGNGCGKVANVGLHIYIS